MTGQRTKTTARARGATATAALLTLFMAHGAGAAGPVVPESIEKNIAARLEAGLTPGLVCTMIDARGVATLARGVASKENGRPVAEDTVFEIGSITKVFTTSLFSIMIERREVGLTDPVSKYLPDSVKPLERGSKPVTLFHLAVHSSGLPRLPDNFEPADVGNPYADYDETRLFAFLDNYEIPREVGTQYEYSNLGAGLLGVALARAAGTDFESLMVDRLCSPLGLDDTRIHLSEEQKARLARGHLRNGQPAPPWDIPTLAGAGALRSTPRDMARFVKAHMGLVDTPIEGALERTRKGRFETGTENLTVSLGWHVWNRQGREIVWHNGGTGGFRSFCGFVPSERLGVVVLSNSNDSVDDLGLHALDPSFDLAKVRRAVPVAPGVLDDYVGYYELEPGVLFHVTRQGDALFVQLTGQDRFPVFAESKDTFFYKIVDAQLTFQRSESGEVERLTLHQGGVDRAAEKLGAGPRAAAPRKEIPVSVEKLGEYAGVYRLEVGPAFDVRVVGGRLTVQVTGQPRFEVYGEGPDRFFFKVVDAQISFERNEAGRVAALILHQGGEEQRAARE